MCAAPVRAAGEPWSARCPECGTWTSTLDPEVNSDLHETIDVEQRLVGLRALRERNNRRILEEIAAVRGPGSAHVLDVGPAHGWFMETAVAAGHEVEGVEPEVMLADAARGRGLAVRTGYFPSAVDAGERFDVIAFNDVLEHIPDVGATLEACVAHLVPGGVLSINIPSATGLGYRIATALRRVGLRGPYLRFWQHGLPSPHVHYFPPDALVRLVEAHGLIVRRVIPLSSVERSGLWARIHTIRRPGPGSVAQFLALWLVAPVLNRPSSSDIVLVVAERPAGGTAR